MIQSEKIIVIALPLEAINAASAREKSIIPGTRARSTYGERAGRGAGGKIDGRDWQFEI